MTLYGVVGPELRISFGGKERRKFSGQKDSVDEGVSMF